MAEYVSIPTETDPDALAQDAFDYLEAKSPSWRPHDAQLDTWLISAAARMLATLNDTMTDVQANIFRYFGANILQITPQEAIPATSTASFTLIDNTGHTIPAGTAIGIPNEGGELVAFETKETIVVTAGSTTALHVPVASLEPGSEGSGIGTIGQQLTMLDQLSFVMSVTLDAVTSGGQDAESDEDYLSRLVSEIRLLAPRPIIPSDFSELARTIPGVHRALALNGYDPVNGLYTNERTVAVAAVNAAGAEVSGSIKKEIEELLLSKREVNFVIKMIPVTFTAVGVEFEVRKWPEWNSEDILKRCEEALDILLSPADWGQPPFGDRNIWYPRSEVKRNDVIAALGAVQGVEDVLKVKISSGAGALEEKDIALPGVAALPQVGTLKGTVA